MKLSDIFEIAEPGTTSVQSIGKIEFQAFPNRVNIIKRDQDNKPSCIAKIKRKTGEGWSLVPTECWKKMNLPHFGNIQNIKTPVNGMKAISSNLKTMLRTWGVTTDEIQKYTD